MPGNKKNKRTLSYFVFVLGLVKRGGASKQRASAEPLESPELGGWAEGSSGFTHANQPGG